MTDRVVLRPTRRRRGRAARLWLIMVVLLGAGWSLLWLIAQQQAAQAMDAWFAAEAARGRPWSCPDRDISGFPLRFTISCSRPTFTVRAGGETVRGQLAGVSAESSVLRPAGIRASLASPMTLQWGEEADAVEITWSALTVDLGTTLAADARAGIDAEGLAVVRPNQPPAHVDRAGVSLVTPVFSGSARRDYRLAANLAGIAVPELDEATGDAAPLTLDATATITALEVAGLEPWRDLVERWRLAGGKIELASLNYAKGPLGVAARGQLGLDDLHRPSGQVQAAVTGYESLADRLGLPLRAVSFGGALAGLLNGPAKTPAPDPGRAALTVPIALGGGRLAIGPFKTSLRLAPIY